MDQVIFGKPAGQALREAKSHRVANDCHDNRDGAGHSLHGAGRIGEGGDADVIGAPAIVR